MVQLERYFVVGAIRLLIVGLTTGFLCFSQNVTLGISSGSASPGSSLTLNVSLNNPAANPAASMEWTLHYSTTDFSSIVVTPGASATAANKSVTCTYTAGSASCLVFGINLTPISSGIVANVTLSVSNATSDSSSTIQFASATAAGINANALSLSVTSANVTILQPGLNGFSCNSVNITPPSTTTCTLALTSAAPSSGTTIALSSSPADATLPSSVTIPSGARSAQFTVGAGTVSSATPVTLTASYGGAHATFGLVIDPVSVTTGSSVLALAVAPAGSGTLTASPLPVNGAYANGTRCA